jgi:hypothetical protein
MTPTEINADESEVRTLRDNIYGPSSDGNRNACKENWMRSDSVEWLKAHQPKNKWLETTK